MQRLRRSLAVIALTGGLMLPIWATQMSAQRAGAPAPPPGAPAPAGRAQGGGGRGGGGAAADFWPGLKHLLAVADVQSGYHHDSISHALATVEQIGRKSSTYMTMIRTDSQLVTKSAIAGQGRYEGRGVNARTLDFYDAIFMLPSEIGRASCRERV